MDPSHESKLDSSFREFRESCCAAAERLERELAAELGEICGKIDPTMRVNVQCSISIEQEALTDEPLARPIRCGPAEIDPGMIAEPGEFKPLPPHRLPPGDFRYDEPGVMLPDVTGHLRLPVPEISQGEVEEVEDLAFVRLADYCEIEPIRDSVAVTWARFIASVRLEEESGRQRFGFRSRPDRVEVFFRRRHGAAIYTIAGATRDGRVRLELAELLGAWPAQAERPEARGNG